MTNVDGDRLIARVPCQLMKATIHIRDPSTLSPLHLLTLKAVAERGDLKAILDAFGMGRRVMQGVLADLFYAGLLYLNLRKGKAVLAQRVADSIRAGELEDLLSVRTPREVEMVWVREMASGGLMVFPHVSKYLRHPDYAASIVQLVARPGRVTSLKDLPVRTLAKTALHLLEEQVTTGGSVIDLVERITNRRLVGSRFFYVPIRVLKPRPDDSHLLLPEVRRVPRPVVDAWTAMLNPEREPLELVVSEQAQGDPIHAMSPEGMEQQWKRAIGQLRRVLQKGKAEAADTEIAAELVVQLEDLARQMTEATRAYEELKLITGPASGHLSALEEAVGHAKHVVIIGSAFLKPNRLGDIAAMLEPAVERGVRVALLWGLANVQEESTETEILSESSSILDKNVPPSDHKGGGGIWLVPSESPFHSKFVAVDGTRALIGSFNWLSSGGQGKTWEATAVIVGGTLPSEVLDYGLERLPSDHPVRESAERMEDPGRLTTPVSGSPISPWAEALAKVAEEMSERGTNRESSGVLAEALDEAERAAEEIRNGGMASLVRDSEHRRFLTSAMAGADSRFVVSSDRVRRDGAGRVFERLAREALARGVRMTIRWGRELPGSPLGEDVKESLTRVEELKASLGPHLDINDEPLGVHGKVLAIDRRFSLISSYNLLSFGGVAGRERTLSGELGLAVFGDQTATALESSLEAHGTNRRLRANQSRES